MKNTNPPPRRCYLSMYWAATASEVQAHYDHAHSVMDALIKGGMKEAEAKAAVEALWSGGRQHGYDDATYDANDG